MYFLEKYYDTQYTTEFFQLVDYRPGLDGSPGTLPLYL